jgi:multicomponent Na+:H+ antiporter subunit B
MDASGPHRPSARRLPGARSILGAIVFSALAGGLILGMSELPEFGDPSSPASTHVSPRFIEDAAAETGAANMVTAVLADYRGYDTLGETAVIFAAGLGCLVILASAGPRPDLPAAGMSHPFGSIILDAVARILVPIVLLFAVYVLVHGHISPGGGFQGGVLFGSGLIMMRLVWGPGGTGRGVPSFGPSLRGALMLACAGILGYVGIGLASMVFGGEFLNYGALPLGSDPAHVRELATLGIEAAVFLTVAGTVAVLFDTISIGIREDGVPLGRDGEAGEP